MKPWTILTALAVLLVATGIWLVWPQSPEPSALPEQDEGIDVLEAEKAPIAAPTRDTKVDSPQPEPALDQTGVIRALEEVAKNREAMEDWDRQMAQACKNLVKDKKYEEAQQCYQLRLARNPQDALAYVERGSLNARMGRREEAYWDYQKYLELEPDGSRAPQIRKILEQYDDFAVDGKIPEVKRDDQRLEVVRMAKQLYQEAYAIQKSDPQEALRKLKIALKLLPEDEQVYRNRIDRLTKRIAVREQ